MRKFIFHPEHKKLIKHYLIIISILFNFMLLGGILNLTVANFNGGLMPVQAYYEFEDSEHFSFQDNSEVKFPFLADIFNTPSVNNRRWTFSIGDVFIFTFGGLIILQSGIFIRENYILGKKINGVRNVKRTNTLR